MMLSIQPYTPPEMVFLMGLPGAGKSTWICHHLSGFRRIDADLIKATHPEYDPKNPSATHDWSARIADHQFAYAVSRGLGQWAADTTGANLGRMREWMQLSTQAGFRVGLVYIKCGVETALSRNRDRERVVPEHLILQKAQSIPANFVLLAPLASYAVEIDNEADDTISQLPTSACYNCALAST